MASNTSVLLRDLLTTTKDGDWGKDVPIADHVPFKVIRGADFPEVRIGDYSTVPLCYLNANTVFRRRLEPLDILIETAGGNRDRPTGRTIIVTERALSHLGSDTTCASFCRFLRVNRKLADPRYVYWYLQFLYSQGVMWNHQVQHTGVARFQYTKFAESTLIPLPAREQQDRIADILGTLDDKIEVNRRTNETLEAMAKALFKSWFVDFDPVREKSAGRRPTGLDAATAKLFPATFEDSPLGPIPKGWKTGTVGECFKITMGQSPPGESYNESGDGVVFYQGRAEFGFRYPTPRLFCTAPTRFADAGDSLVSVRAPVGDVNLASERTCIGRGLAAVRHATGSRSFTYYSMLAQSEAFARFEADGTVFGSINKDSFVKLPMVVPPEPLVQAFEDVAFGIDQRIELNVEESRTLAATRDALLPKLLSGEVTL